MEEKPEFTTSRREIFKGGSSYQRGVGWVGFHVYQCLLLLTLAACDRDGPESNTADLSLM